MLENWTCPYCGVLNQANTECGLCGRVFEMPGAPKGAQKNIETARREEKTKRLEHHLERWGGGADIKKHLREGEEFVAAFNGLFFS